MRVIIKVRQSPSSHQKVKNQIKRRLKMILIQPNLQLAQRIKHKIVAIHQNHKEAFNRRPLPLCSTNSQSFLTIKNIRTFKMLKMAILQQLRIMWLKMKRKFWKKRYHSLLNCHPKSNRNLIKRLRRREKK